MHISNTNASILGLGSYAFDRLGLERFFPNYQILALNDTGFAESSGNVATKIWNLESLFPDLKSKVTDIPTALKEVDWVKLKNQIGFNYLLTYKPTRNQAELTKTAGITVLNNSFDLFTQLEHKANFRRFLKNADFFPRYQTLKLVELKSISFLDIFTKFEKFVIQDALLSAGKGTFVVSTLEAYQSALKRLTQLNSEEVVVSQFIQGRSASVQVCITQYGNFCLPLQLQVINQPELVETSLPNAQSFNGGQWSPSDFTAEENRVAKKYAQIIAQELKNIGYKGIFGIDFIVSESGIFVIEVNARLTGMTAAITGIQESLGQIPLLLFHTLEHAQIEYHLTPEEIDQIHRYTWGDSDYAYLILFNNQMENYEISNPLSSGLYRVNDTKNLAFQSATYKVGALNKNNLLLIDFKHQEKLVFPNDRIGRLVIKNRVVTPAGTLTPEIKNTIQSVKNVVGRYNIQL